MANEENLIPFSERSENEAREMGRKGGIASGAARRRKRSMREAADLFLSLPVSDKRKANKLARKGIDAEDIDNQMAIIVGLSEAATAGDARAAAVILKLIGEIEPKSDENRDAIEKARELLGGIESVIE